MLNVKCSRCKHWEMVRGLGHVDEFACNVNDFISLAPYDFCCNKFEALSEKGLEYRLWLRQQPRCLKIRQLMDRDSEW